MDKKQLSEPVKNEDPSCPTLKLQEATKPQHLFFY